MYIKDTRITHLPRIYPEDFSGNNIGEKVMDCMDFVKKSNGGYEVFFGNTGEYLINSAIEIPSNTTIKIENCTIRMADNIVDNIFRSANIIPNSTRPLYYCENYNTIDWVENIKIIGNNATIIMEENASIYGIRQVGWRGCTTYFIGVNGFEISGLTFIKNLYCSVMLCGCYNGSVHDIVYNTSRLNGDGIDINVGANISVYNLSGTTQDDTIYVGSLLTPGRITKQPTEVNIPVQPIHYDDTRFGSTAHDIFIENINTNGGSHVLTLLASNYDVYNVSARQLSDTYDGTSGKFAIVKVYGGQYNGTYVQGAIHNCTIREVTGNNCSQGAVFLSEGVIEHGRIYDITVPSGATAVNNQSGVDLEEYDMVIRV